MIVNSGLTIGQTFGMVEDVDTSSRHLRIRVHVNITIPFKRCTKISMNGGQQVLIGFQYERLLDFCYVCEKMDHQKNDCLLAFKMKKDSGQVKREYGPWLRVVSYKPALFGGLGSHGNKSWDAGISDRSLGNTMDPRLGVDKPSGSSGSHGRRDNDVTSPISSFGGFECNNVQADNQ
ncbi:hypothetical protein REPUB_Repub12eG0064700 [Reevesia pubescens]